jgi:ribonucleases P/MRP protein subunit RPP40
MLPGRKAFDRIQWSFKNVLNSPITWLFCDVNQPADSSLSPLQPHHPQARLATAVVSNMPQMHIPTLCPPLKIQADYNNNLMEYGQGVYEYISLLSLSSPRVHASDDVDPYLSRYDVNHAPVEPGQNLPITGEIVRILYSGLLPSLWISDLFTATQRATQRHTVNLSMWFSFSVHGFQNTPISWEGSQHGNLNGGENQYCILRTPVRPTPPYVYDKSQNITKEEQERASDITDTSMSSGKKGSRPEYVMWEIVGSQDQLS